MTSPPPIITKINFGGIFVPIYYFQDGDVMANEAFGVYVPEQSFFRRGLKNTYDNNETMTEAQAEEARTMKITRETHSKSYSYFQKRLKENNFKMVLL